MICLAILFSIPCALLGYNVESIYLALFLLAFPAIVSSFYFVPMLAMLHGVVTIKVSAMASAITLFIVNLIALGLGPTVTGVVSDALSSAYGDESLRYALMLMSIIPLWATYHFYSASRHLDKDTVSH